MTRAQKVALTIVYLVRLSLVVALLRFAATAQWFGLFMTLLALGTSFIPFLLKKKYVFYLPFEFELVLFLFVYASLFLGEAHGYYTLFWWWDGFLHGVSGIILGFVGFFIVYMLNTERTVQLSMSPIFVVIFSFTFAVTIGSLWEVF